MYVYTSDIGGDLLLNTENNYQVMMEWEKQYMVDLIKKLNPSGKVLEIGFGLGISASEIQKYDIESHTIIEYDETVLERLEEWASKQKHKVNIVRGKWQDVLKTLGKFDSIFSDDSPDHISDLEELRGYRLFYDILRHHANVGCKYSYYLSEFTFTIMNPLVTYDVDIKKYDIPEHCKYTSGSEMYLPLITFKLGTCNLMNEVSMDYNLNCINEEFLC
jgi:hypothetical protein